MLRRLRLFPYKVHRNLVLDNIPGLSLIVGANNTGRSALLHAAAIPDYGIRWDSELLTAPVDDPTVTGDPIA